jgi:integrase
MPLTELAIKAARPEEKPRRLHDAGGLYLEVTPAGSRLWRWKYRFAKKERRLALGAHPEVSLRQARELRDGARRLLAGGQDPGAARRTAKARADEDRIYTLRAAVADWLAFKGPSWKAGTREAIAASFVTHVFPGYGDRPAAAIKATDVRAMIRAVDAGGAGDTAGRLFQRLRSVFRHALGAERLAADPTYTLRPAEILQARRVRHRAALPLSAMPEFLQRLDGYGGDPTTRAALGLLALTAVRPGAAWAEIEWDASLWRIPAGRMKMETQHIVPLSRQALQLLRAIEPLTGAATLIFPSPFYPGRPLSDGTMNSALARMGWKGSATAHGFRSTFSTAANEAGWRAEVIERQLSHEERDAVRAAYNHAQYLDERRELLQWWADRLDALRAGGEVIQLRPARA